MIPKVVYQSWYTRSFHPIVEQKLETMRRLNPGYRFVLYTDEEMDAFVNKEFPGEIADCYNRLNIIVAKVDFWRYLILYKKGGIYLDIDSAIISRLDSFIREDDRAIISREGNPGVFLQWGLMFEAGHPILKSIIDECIQNIESRTYTHIPEVVGPVAFTRAIHNTLCPYLGENLRNKLYFIEDNYLNHQILKSVPENTQCRFYNVDYKNICVWKKYPNCEALYKQQPHWLSFTQKDTFC